jgi:sulfate adenylyltransferase large subunit
MLRIATAGNVDDGKSTLIGRLFHDSKILLEDQVEELAAQAKKRGGQAGQLDLAALTDGLKAEREQGITIDVAYRYFATPRRSFILADSPGHAQYTRNMVTGASTADCAIVLVDAQNGVTTQTRRHTYLASLLGVRHLAVAVNKMDLVDFDAARFAAIVAEFRRFAGGLGDGGVEVAAFPISALDGDNVVESSRRTPWYNGPPLLAWLEELPAASLEQGAPLRLPIQTVIHPGQAFRGFAGQVARGSLRLGDEVEILPARKTTRVARIASFDGDLEEAPTGRPVVITLEDEIDVGRGDLVVHPGQAPTISDRITATLVWMSERPLDPSRTYLVKHTTRTVKTWVQSIEHRIDVDTLATQPAEALALNEIGVVTLVTAQPLYFDSYTARRELGGLILIDPETNGTVGAGMIHASSPEPASRRPGPARAPQVVESRMRAVAKTASYRVFGSLATTALAYGMSGSVSTAFAVGGFEVVGKLALYYWHERLWSIVPFGRREVQAYES